MSTTWRPAQQLIGRVIRDHNSDRRVGLLGIATRVFRDRRSRYFGLLGIAIRVFRDRRVGLLGIATRVFRDHALGICRHTFSFFGLSTPLNTRALLTERINSLTLSPHPNLTPKPVNQTKIGAFGDLQPFRIITARALWVQPAYGGFAVDRAVRTASKRTRGGKMKRQ
jgi:hypothetical protein